MREKERKTRPCIFPMDSKRVREIGRGDKVENGDLYSSENAFPLREYDAHNSEN